MWHNERIGLIVVFSSLSVIIIISMMLFASQRSNEQQQIRTHVGSLVQIIGKMSWDDLVADNGQDLLSALHYSRGNSRYAYVSVLDDAGKSHRQMTVPGVVAPPSTGMPETTVWMGEREVPSTAESSAFVEYFSPIVEQGQKLGYVRIGYFKPGFGISYSQLPFLAAMALPVFMLAPLFYFLLKREVRPLQQMSSKITSQLEQATHQKLELHANGEVSSLLDHLNKFVELSASKTSQLEKERNDLFAASRLLGYKQDKFDALMQTIPDAIIVLDTQGVPSFANDKLIAALGVAPGQVVGKKIRSWCQIDEVSNYLSRFENRLFHDFTGESISFTPDKHKDQFLRLSAYPLFSPKDNSKLLGTLIVIRDASEEHMAKVARGEFVAQLAHELKTPLNVLGMYSEALMGEDGESSELRVEGLNIIHDQVERLSNLINNLLAITKFELEGMQLQRQRVRLHDLLEDALNTLSQSDRGKQLEFVNDMPKEVSAIYADKELLNIAINNLLTNAIKYNKPGGKVIVRVEETDEQVSISVRDTGIGISPEDQQHVFEKFYRSDAENVREQNGHGLGLSLVDQIVRQHHGQVDVKSAPGQGTEFTIRLEKFSNVLQQAAN